MTTKNKRGRGRPPRELTQAIADRLCEQIVAGKSLRRICKAKSMPSNTTVLGWLRDHPEFARQYALAREEQADGYADELIDLASKANADNAHAVRVRADIIKWVCSKLKPRKYGDRLELQGDLNVNAGPGAMPDKPFAEWGRDERLDWMRRTVYLLAQVGREVRDLWGLEELAEGYGFLGTETWRQVLAEIDGRKEPAARPAALLPAPAPVPVYREVDRRPKPQEREINPIQQADQ